MAGCALSRGIFLSRTELKEDRANNETIIKKGKEKHKKFVGDFFIFPVKRKCKGE